MIHLCFFVIFFFSFYLILHFQNFPLVYFFFFFCSLKFITSTNNDEFLFPTILAKIFYYQCLRIIFRKLTFIFYLFINFHSIIMRIFFIFLFYWNWSIIYFVIDVYGIGEFDVSLDDVYVDVK